MKDAIERLRIPKPAGIVAARDTFAIRGLVILLCVFGVFGAKGDVGPRFVRAPKSSAY